MAKKNLNTNMNKAKKTKNDEFYTLIEDIAKEVALYVPQLKNKTIYCNCDSENSNFWKLFLYNFNHLQLKKLIATSYNNKEITYKLEYDGKNITKTPLQQNGDFRSPECIDILKESDIVITNPPFSLFREYVSQLIKHEKQFLIIGNQNAISYREIFFHIKENRIWLGYNTNKVMEFRLSKDYDKWNRIDKKTGIKYGKVPGITWYTNLEVSKRHEELILYKEYKPKDYPKYDNYDAINVNKIIDIPKEYYGAIGVPITFLDKYNPEQFEMIGLGISNSGIEIGVKPYKEEHKKYRKNIQNKRAIDGDLYMLDEKGNPKVPYARILIKRRVQHDK